jgi:hypothetical protein
MGLSRKAVTRVLGQHALVGKPVVADLGPEPPDLIVIGGLNGQNMNGISPARRMAKYFRAW